MNGKSALDKAPGGEANVLMSSKPDMGRLSREPRQSGAKPVWAEGLKRMYDSVVSEEIPDEFVELLKQLDHPRDKS